MWCLGLVAGRTLAISAIFKVIVAVNGNGFEGPAPVTSPSSGDSFSTAMERLDRALNRLDISVRSLSGRMRSTAQLHDEGRRLVAERSQLAGELDKANARAERLDQTAEDVSQRLDEAMAAVRSVLEQGDVRG